MSPHRPEADILCTICQTPGRRKPKCFAARSASTGFAPGVPRAAGPVPEGISLDAGPFEGS
jgi:hypothetical protein